MKLLELRLLFILILLPLLSHAQELAEDPKLDSLKTRLSQVTTDTSRAMVLEELSDYWLQKDSAKAMDYARQILALKEAEKSNYIRGIGHSQIGSIYGTHNQLDSSKAHSWKAIQFLQTESFPNAQRYLSNAWRNYGLVHQIEGNEKEYMNILLNKSLPIRYSIKDTIGIGVVYNALGEVMMNNGELEEADQYYNKAIDILSNHPNHKHLHRAHINAARNLMLNGDNDTPGQNKKIREHLNLANNYFAPDEKSYNRVEYFINNGLYYIDRENNMEQALDNYEKGIMLANKIGYNYALAELAFQKFRVYLDNEQFAKAKPAGYEAYQLYKEFSIPENWLMVLSQLVKLEEKTGNILKAYELLNQYVELSDSVKEEEAQLEILELEKKFENEQKENEILRLKNANTQQELRLERTRLWAYLTGGLALLLVGGFLFGFKIYRNKQQINRQKEQLHKQEIEKMKQEQRLSNFSAMLEGQEQERKRIAGELHDGLGGTLSGIKLQLSQLVTENKTDQLPDILPQLDNSVNELRRIAQNLMPESLLRYNLSTALNEFCRTMDAGQATITFQAYRVDNDGISQTVKIMLYRIVQELVTNAVKHANASTILVQLTQNGSILDLTVEDDGSGFDPDSKTHDHGLGLSTIKSRVEYLKGHLEFFSELGTGTTVSIEIDIDSEAISNHPVTVSASNE